MADRPFLATVKYQDQQNRAVREGAHDYVLQFEKKFIRHLKKMGLPFFAHNMVRTNSEQNALYVQGRSKAKAGEGAHPFGCAVDIVHSTRAWGLSKDEWLLIGHIGKEISGRNGLKLVWGGDWSFYDPAHWELKDWRSVKSEFPFPKRG